MTKRLGGWWRLWILGTLVWGVMVMARTNSHWPIYFEVPPGFISSVLPPLDSSFSPELRRRDSLARERDEDKMAAAQREARAERPTVERALVVDSVMRFIGPPLLVLIAVWIGRWVRRGFLSEPDTR
jgi:hypothetical protein